MLKKIRNFLEESNAIEGVYDKKSLEQAVVAWEFICTKKVMTIGAILKMHKILMLHQPLMPNEKGYFRTCDVMVGGYIAPSSDHVRASMEQWVLNLNDVAQNGKKENRTFLKKTIQQHHVLYEKIHPFVDGNGRTGRMLMNWERLQVGLPILIIKEKERFDYYKWFK